MTVSLNQCLSTFFDSWYPFLEIEQFCGTPSYNLLVNKRQVQKLAAALEFFRAPKGAMTSWLRTTALNYNFGDANF